VAQVNCSLRPANAGDEAFLRELYASTRQAELALLPWSAEAKQQFVRMQFDAQRRHYRATYPNAYESIVLAGAAPAGRIYVDRQDAQMLIVDLTLLPQFQRQAIGRMLVSDLQREAAKYGKAIAGHVERWNPARMFWQRMGFNVGPGNDMYYRISWTPIQSLAIGS